MQGEHSTIHRTIKKLCICCAAVILTGIIEIYRKVRPVPESVYFCYNQSIHHIYHSLYIAVELSNIQNKYPVIVFSTSKEASHIIEAELSSIPNNVKFVKIYHPGYSRINFSINWFVFLCRIRMHKPKAVIVTDYYDNVFRQLLLKSFWIFVNHGQENREYAHPHLKDYDLMCVPGQRQVERLESRIGPLHNYVVTGYPKFDYFRYHAIEDPGLFKDSKPVIMYNPHFDVAQSSFYDKGLELLKALSACGKYNIIFMPHPDLSRTAPHLVKEALNMYNVASVIRQKINLEYMAVTDLYIADVSSSIYEWLYFDRPAVFFNSRQVDWKAQNLYPAWTVGAVVDDIPEMLEVIDHSLLFPGEFQDLRREMFMNCFYYQEEHASKNAADIILDKTGK